MTKTKLKWEYIGDCGVDAGTLMIGDPCYFIGKDSDANRSCDSDWGTFLKKYRDHDSERYRLQHQLHYNLGHAGLGVMAGTAHGDGCFPVLGLKADGEDTDRCHAMLVVTGDHDELPKAVKKAMKEAFSEDV
tara:strand:+ start:167 stop:562 length:396 start_codon:yes stop_codon:yes gene_type:complete